MIKVIIADDEEKICRLIHQLIDWKALDMEISAIVHNGIDAIKMIEEIKPDIVITDIRMPGYNGLEMIEMAKQSNVNSEFIIISGYRHFEYAKRAIKYGVKDYLLKPINKLELTSALEGLRKEYFDKQKSLSTQEQYNMVIKNHKGKIRTGFFRDILFTQSKIGENIDFEYINDQYKFHFQKGYYQIIAIKIDQLTDTSLNYISYIYNKISKCIHKHLNKLCIDYEYIFEDTLCYILINYKEEHNKEIYEACRGILAQIALQKDILEDLKVTIGIGKPQLQMNKLHVSLKTALWAIEERIIVGMNKIIDGKYISTNYTVDNVLVYELNKRIIEALEELDRDKLIQSFTYLEESLLNMPNITGYEIIQMCKAAVNLYILTMSKNQFKIQYETDIFEEFTCNINDIGSAKGIFDYLSKNILDLYQYSIEHKKQELNRPVLEAQRYIREHYKEPISLEIVSDYVGFNPTYFSTLFKKETETTFVRYLTNVRMNKAKELLRETNLNIAHVCAEVGYLDIKHFTKNFIKYTNLRPKEYRKIYS